MDWRYQPLHGFAVGAEPFRARGLAYNYALRYIDRKLPGGRAALGLGARAAFYDQIFLAISDYDISPLLALYNASAAASGLAAGAFIEERARWSGAADSQGVWKRPLAGASAQEVAERLAFAFRRYFPPCDATPLEASQRRFALPSAARRGARAGSFAGELVRVPACMDGLYVHCTAGFFRGALEAAGAKDVRAEFARPTADGAHLGVPVERVRFVVQWL